MIDGAPARALGHPGGDPEERADAGGERGGRERDEEGHARALGEAGEDVAEQVVDAQPVGRPTGPAGRRARLGAGVKSL